MISGGLISRGWIFSMKNHEKHDIFFLTRASWIHLLRRYLGLRVSFALVILRLTMSSRAKLYGRMISFFRFLLLLAPTISFAFFQCLLLSCYRVQSNNTYCGFWNKPQKYYIFGSIKNQSYRSKTKYKRTNTTSEKQKKKVEKTRL